MSIVFSDEWMKQLAEGWNADKLIVNPLADINFNAQIAYGFINEKKPRGLIVVDQGKVVRSGRYANEVLDWDLRATKSNWQEWLSNGFGLAQLGPAVAMGKLKFVQGDYRQMIRNLAMSRPFLRHFVIMSKLDTDFD